MNAINRPVKSSFPIQNLPCSHQFSILVHGLISEKIWEYFLMLALIYINEFSGHITNVVRFRGLAVHFSIAD
jgi:hypothetical protein